MAYPIEQAIHIIGGTDVEENPRNNRMRAR
jgi:hypothetical protein